MMFNGSLYYPTFPLGLLLLLRWLLLLLPPRLWAARASNIHSLNPQRTLLKCDNTSSYKRSKLQFSIRWISYAVFFPSICFILMVLINFPALARNIINTVNLRWDAISKTYTKTYQRFPKCQSCFGHFKTKFHTLYFCTED